MWDYRPNQDASWKYDTGIDGAYPGGWNRAHFFAVERSDQSNYFDVSPLSQDTFNTVVRNNGAVPVYDEYTSSGGWLHAGSGTLYRCEGKTSPWQGSRVPAAPVTIRLVTPSGLLTKLSAPREKFKSCKAMNRVFPHGLGKPGAKDKVHYAGGRKSTKFKRLTRIYKKNKKLDRDKDGITCEWTPKHKRGDRR